MYVELKSIEEEMSKMDYKEKLPRSCQDIQVFLNLVSDNKYRLYFQMEHSTFSSGQYTIDPNMGSTKDSFKSYCDFKSKSIRTCVKVKKTLPFSHCTHINCVTE